MSWGEAVRKMTALPATMIGLTERGYLLPGMIADITVFDPATVIDRATIDAPTLPSVGIDTVVVNGRLALDAGRPTGSTIGRALARGPHEPGRAMNMGTRSLKVGDVGAAGLPIRIRLDQGTGVPVGSVRLDGLGVGSVRPGPAHFAPALLQTADGWASVTGIGTWPDGSRRAVTLIAEAADPFTGGRPVLTMFTDGRQVAQIMLRPQTIGMRQAPSTNAREDRSR